MKTISKLCIIIAASASMLAGCAGEYIVRERPVEPVYERPVAPYPGAVWISGEWVWRGDHYERMRGHWERPRSRVWVEGHWRETPGGYVWVRGHWQ
ncbi:hypothetical protein BEL04_06035 [Mucilaginibacter sp. PPCGB 2223]|uniref:YXWGXW repeat-containing protein n=1 Tax=Mucilaginibacter sp. PPCGB 2223 TaxID=1886027 RepID=UPI0008263256|nr:YXWGXW repeat-containing protein [Mucilaginibacter sp. PPCGB 2223]OCX53842.1 hypothetical protein BEL04_06035 [Mucilaginibacter sp. PPCGB 2223]